MKLRAVLVVVTFLLTLLVVALLVADAAVLCARSRDGAIYDGNLKVRREACRNYEQPVGILEGTAVPVQGPPGPPGEKGEQGDPGPPGPAALFPRLNCVWFVLAYSETPAVVCERVWPGSSCVEGISGSPHGHLQCGQVAGQNGFALCCDPVE